MPSYGQMVETVRHWREMPAPEAVVSTGAAALTFDDGPDPEGTPAVLDALDAVGVRATFFVVGEQLVHHRALARETAARGHELALHCFEHVGHDSLSPQATRDDMARAVGAFEAALGSRPRLYRPPYGRFNEASYAARGALELLPIYWSAWGMDWESIAAERIAELVEPDLTAGAIVLLHDSARYAHRPSVAPTVEAVGMIAALAHERGLGLQPVGELLPLDAD